MTEQLAVEQLPAQRAAIHSEEGLTVAGACSVDGIGEDLLPCTGPAIEQDGRVRRSHLLGQVDHLLDRWGAPGDRIERMRCHGPELLPL